MAIELMSLPRSTQYTMRAVSAASDMTPAFGGADQRIARKGSRFALDISIPALSAKSCGMALLADLLRGETEPLAVAVPEHIPPADYGTPVVVGVVAGSVLPVSGLPAGRMVPKGKFLSVVLAGQRYVHMVTEAATATSGGSASLKLWPMLRRPTINGASVELAAPKIEGFVEPGQDWTVGSLPAVGMSFSIKERD